MSKKIISDNSNFFDVHQAAEFLGVNPGTIRRWAQTKTINGLKIGIRGDWRFTKIDILELVKGDEVLTSFSPNVSGNNLKKGEVAAPQHMWNKFDEHEHFVQFYEDDIFLLNSLTKFMLPGLESDEACIIIATKDHRDNFEKLLEISNVSVEKARMRNQYIDLDATETLSKFMVDGLPNPTLFKKVIGEILSDAEQKWSRIRAFGEMVALLWAEGNKSGAIKLEELWNDLSKEYTFSLFCAYPMNKFGKSADGDQFQDIGTRHTKVIPSESYNNLESSDERMRAVAKLQQKAASLEAEIKRRKDLEKQKDEFINIASHELKTPVTSIKAYAQILCHRFKKQGDEISASYMTKMDVQVDKLTDLISDLLDISKIDGKKLSYKAEKFDFSTLVNEVIDEVHLTALSFKIEKDTASTKIVEADRNRIAQVITNLLSNAVKYSPKTNRVIVQTTSSDTDVTLSVKDFGVGIPKDKYERIFERFYRVHENGKQFSGMGLGLYISAEIIKRHQGKIWITSEEGKGSTFYFTLPLKTSS